MSRLILVVDDDPMAHKLLEFALKEQSFEVLSTMSATEAQEVLEERSSEILAIILDWEMPGMSGVDLLKWLKKKEEYKEIPVIMLTGKTGKEEVKIGIEAGAFYYVTKPFNKEFLQSLLRSAINDYMIIKQLEKRLNDSQNPFANLVEGTFHFKTLEEASRLSAYVANACPQPQEVLIICEIFNNAIEHGNLGITYDEKSALIDDNVLKEELEQRLADAKYGGRVAVLKFEKRDGEIYIYVRDEGDGFDFGKYLTFDAERVFDNHGRGIAMANTVLDIKYLGKGNEVEVRIPLNGTLN